MDTLNAGKNNSQPMYLNFLEFVREMIIVFIMVILPSWFKNANNTYPNGYKEVLVL